MAIAARNGVLSRNFQGYTTDTAPALIGIGASAISSLPQGYLQNETDVPKYRELIRAGKLADRARRCPHDGRQDPPRDHRAPDVQPADRPDGTCAPTWISSPDHFSPELSRLKELQKLGFVNVDGWKISVPADERAAVRLVCAVFDEYLDPAAARHAMAV